MEATMTLKIRRFDLVPSTNKAQWLEKHGVPAEVTEIQFEVPLQLCEDAGIWIEDDGTISHTDHDVAPLRDKAIEKLQRGETFDANDAIPILTNMALERKRSMKEKAEQEAKRREAVNALRKEWLEMPDGLVVKVEWMHGHWDSVILSERTKALPDVTGNWTSCGHCVLPRLSEDQEVRAAFNRRAELGRKLVEEREAIEAEREAELLKSLHDWASMRSERVTAGLAKGYNMNGAIGQVLFEEFEAALQKVADTVDPLEVRMIVDGSPDWNTMEFETKKNPSLGALQLSEACEQAILDMKLPPAVEVELPEVTTLKFHGRRTTCVSMEVSTLSLGDRIIFVECDHLVD